MAFVRSIGRWTMTTLVINCIIGGGIFGLPVDLARLLGRASPFAMIFAAGLPRLVMGSRPSGSNRNETPRSSGGVGFSTVNFRRARHSGVSSCPLVIEENKGTLRRLSYRSF
jgi:hypothetical protein